ncbi:ABC transporter substrate-binding protein [Kurthia huakuii]|uniref:ABC transporter substrate-binding protein n=1 Tax=Kurthia huakuii TaxID=1421019 RepID=UPI00049627DE|nr:ABC transporter substrate-binding protein [Kurthia huakuii]MBM7698912.1 iron complex transport system substrate-binding protein [Kurthia huakuii]
MKKWMSWGSAVAVSAMLLSGCGTTADQTNEKDKTTQSAQQNAYPMNVKDATGKEVEIKQEPSKIITLSPSITETLFALGLGDKVEGVTSNDDYPKEATEKPKVGDMNPNIEKIISLEPDFVMIDESSMSTAEAGLAQLRDAGITVFVVPTANSFDETYASIELIGKVTNKEDEAKKIVADMNAKIADVQQKINDSNVKERSVFVETSDAPDIYTAGNNSYMQEMFDLIGANNIAKDGGENWYKIDAEAIVKGNPDVIIVKYDYVPNIVNKIKKRDGFDTITAVKENQIVQVDDNLTSRTGPRLADGLEEIAKAIYPEAFK